MSDLTAIERMIEALLFAAAEPLALSDFVERLPQGADAAAGLAALQSRYAGRGVELVPVGGRWRFQTGAEIEAIRGVQASRGTLDLLLEIGLVRLRGRRRTPGRPVTIGTTDAFLELYGLASLADLPGASEMKAAGLLDLDLPAGFSVPGPMSGDAEEDPLEDADSPEFQIDFLGDGGSAAQQP